MAHTNMSSLVWNMERLVQWIINRVSYDASISSCWRCRISRFSSSTSLRGIFDSNFSNIPGRPSERLPRSLGSRSRLKNRWLPWWRSRKLVHQKASSRDCLLNRYNSSSFRRAIAFQSVISIFNISTCLIKSLFALDDWFSTPSRSQGLPTSSIVSTVIQGARRIS